MKPSKEKELSAWLQTSPPLSELCAFYPEEWETVQRELAAISEIRHPKEIVSCIERLSRKDTPRARKSPTLAVRETVRYQMARAAIAQHCASVASGVKSGKLRFNLLNGFAAQKVLFRRGLERKAVSLFWFRLLWPLIWQRRFLMPLVHPKGIYCFYSRQLIVKLSEIIGRCSCLEIAAGDGTLTRLLRERGVQVTATDDYSWGHAISYPKWVEKKDAKDALSYYSPEIVICSWPPSGNRFERHVFRTRSVRLYILITSAHQFAAGDWGAYRQQQSFTIRRDSELSRLVIPPEIDPSVYLFVRKTAVDKIQAESQHHLSKV